MVSSPDSSIVITLVHGTWAHDAQWTRTNSPFCNQLREELKSRGVTNVKFRRFNWSGGNTHRDRRIASVRLRKKLLRQLGSPRNACHYVVAHSHGGNVALRAVCHSPTLRRELSGIVAIATPFLSFAQKNFLLALLAPTLRDALGLMAAYFVWLYTQPLLYIVLRCCQR
jgi:pimeloyl-ACP methyl ester carboxylesterase